MSNRFYDTSKWDRPWFRDLTPGEKCAWEYITSKCDGVGVWVPDYKGGDFNIGEPIDWEEFRKKCNGNILKLENGKWWLIDFCTYQYGPLSPNCKPHASYISLLGSHNLMPYFHQTMKGFELIQEKERVCIPFLKGIGTVQEKEKEEEKEEEEVPPVRVLMNPSGSSRIEKARIVWNESGGVPCKLVFNPEDISSCLRVLGVYSDQEIETAIKNYSDIIKNPEYDVFSVYRSFVGFMRSGVEKFVDEAKPREVYRKRDPEAAEKAERAAFFDRLKKSGQETGGTDDDDE